MSPRLGSEPACDACLFGLRCFAVGSRDMSTWVFGAERWANLIYYSLGGHKDVMVGCFFEKDSLDVSVSLREPPCVCVPAECVCVCSAVHGEPGRDAVCVGERHRAGRPGPAEEPGQAWGRRGQNGGRRHQREIRGSRRDQKRPLQANEQVSETR